MLRQRVILVLALVGALLAAGTVVQSVRAEVVRTRSTFDATVYVATADCPGLVTTQPYFTPFGTTIASAAEVTITQFVDPNLPTEEGTRKVHVTGTAVDANTGDQYRLSFSGRTQAFPDLMGTGQLVFIRQGGGGMIVTASLIIHGDWEFVNVGDVHCLTP